MERYSYYTQTKNGPLFPYCDTYYMYGEPKVEFGAVQLISPWSWCCFELSAAGYVRLRRILEPGWSWGSEVGREVFRGEASSSTCLCGCG
jgi:hypothetical protein